METTSPETKSTFAGCPMNAAVAQAIGKSLSETGAAEISGQTVFGQH